MTRVFGHTDESINSRHNQFNLKIISYQIFLGFVKCSSRRFSLELQRKPDMITTRNVIAVRTTFATLAFFSSSQLIGSTVQFFDLQAQAFQRVKGLQGQSSFGQFVSGMRD